MTRNFNESIIKCDHKVNITASYGADLVLEGFTFVPNMLIKVYSRIGITDFQMMLLIHLIRFKVEEKDYYPAPETISEVMESNPAKIKKELTELLEKEIIAVSEYYDKKNNLIFEGYDFEPLFLKVSDVWASTRAREIVESEDLIKAAALENDFLNSKLRDKPRGLISIFEKEFGRPLSPIEVDQIQIWAGEAESFLVIEALKRAVLRGKHNFKYINSILMEWKKNNLQTLEEIAEYDRDFMKRRSASMLKSQKGGAKSSPAEGKDSKEKVFIRSLYNKA
ncbi:MAG: DnaD domain protein [Desulfotomaculaceae bacterium]|nr:DnaD domain protein [Desulfotomaculaceae bacterium]MDD4767322.1 DnaD domain protein [Desulfotomaculaceae bacterium]